MGRCYQELRVKGPLNAESIKSPRLLEREGGSRCEGFVERGLMLTGEECVVFGKC